MKSSVIKFSTIGSSAPKPIFFGNTAFKKSGNVIYCSDESIWRSSTKESSLTSVRPTISETNSLAQFAIGVGDLRWGLEKRDIKFLVGKIDSLKTQAKSMDLVYTTKLVESVGDFVAAAKIDEANIAIERLENFTNKLVSTHFTNLWDDEFC